MRDEFIDTYCSMPRPMPDTALNRGTYRPATAAVGREAKAAVALGSKPTTMATTADAWTTTRAPTRVKMSVAAFSL